MAAELSLGEQLEVLVARLELVDGLSSVVGLEELDDALELADLLPAAVLFFAGDRPDKPPEGIMQQVGQRVWRHWSVILVTDGFTGPKGALDLIDEIQGSLNGWSPCGGVGCLARNGSRFLEKVDARALYEVRFSALTT